MRGRFFLAVGVIVLSKSLSAAVLPFDPESEEYPLGHGAPGFAWVVGSAFQHTGHGWDTGMSVGARYYIPRRTVDTAGPEALSPWSVEMGGILPHRLSGAAAGNGNSTAGDVIYHIDPPGYSAEHLAVQYRWAIRRPLRMNPELSLGLSVAQFTHSFYAVTAQPFGGSVRAGHSRHTSIGPYARVGLPLLSNDTFAFRLEVGYVRHPHRVNVSGHVFEQGVAGLGVYPSIQIGLGYLRPGINKGVYLPPWVLPLWVMTALQTEKRSPVIAPPEVLLHGRAGQGGLSGNVLFQYKNRAAGKVELLADFNRWEPEPMYVDKAGVWLAVKDLPAGTYHYVFLINGRRELRDPWNVSFDLARRARGVSSFTVMEVLPGGMR